MTELLREQAQYTRGKTPIISKYLVDHKQLFNEIAGRGFLNLPGYAYDLENDIEMAAKFGLSELNYKIMAETIERELKQSGFDYDQTYKIAVIAWEVEKQDLISAWDKELAWIKQGMAEEEEVKERLANEVDARQAVLITAKTAIEVEMEGYRTTLAGLDGATAPYEVLLANAKLLTAQKKLDLIPIIEEIIVKEGELLIIEQGKSAEYTKLMNAEQEVATKKQQLIPGLAELATVTKQHADLIPSQIETEQAIADEKLEQAEIAVEISENKVEELTLDIATANKNVEVSESKRVLDQKQFNNNQTLIELEIDKDTEYQNDLNDSFNTLQADERATQATIISNKTDINDIENDTKLDSVQTLTDAGIAADVSTTAADIHRMEQVAEINAAAAITASLTHLIG